MGKGKPKTTGQFDTREELVAEVWNRWRNTPSNIADIARAVRVSDGVVHHILNTKEGRKQ
jgi:hypothetical protein